VSSYVLVPLSDSLQITDALTIEAWIAPMALGRRIVDKIAPGGFDGYLLDTNDGRLRFSVGADSVESDQQILIVNGGFSHVAGVYDGATLSVYVNGVRVGTKSTPVMAVGTNDLALRIGADSTGESRFVGMIDEVRIYDRALAPTEIAAIAGAGAGARCF
jgi:hypothetical protein